MSWFSCGICWLPLVTLMVGVLDVDGHARLLEPPSRSSMWRFGFATPKNYDDNALNCGGFNNQWGLHGGKCGVCGDPYQGPRQNEAGGKYANGIIVRNYARGQEIEVKVEITANHKGWFEFRLCPHNSPRTRISQQCLNQHLLHITGHGTRFTIPTTLGVVALRVQLPPEVTCRQCVLQWKWHSGNNWGTDRQAGQGCLGCGPQEEFYGCADVSIGGDTGNGGLVLTETSGSNGVNSLNVGTKIKEGRDSTDTRVSHGHAEADVEEKLRTESDPSRTVVRGRCKAAGVYWNVDGVTRWCQLNCELGFCPRTHCACI